MKIDFVITWVDGNDKKWQKEKNKYDNNPKTLANSEVRYRDWDQLKYWFRGVEKYAPWVNKIYFVTCGQKPDWLNINNPKLVLIDHKDYIPAKFLPTFSANPIELNFHRIKDLNEHFVFFNDDMFIINRVKPTDFFKDGLPCDMYIETPLVAYGKKDVFPYLLLNDSELISRNFKNKNYIKKNIFKYINVKYGIKNNLKTLFMMQYNQFSGFSFSHTPSSFLKSTYEEVWSKENDYLEKVSENKFRCKDDVNQYVFKAWQFCTGKFYPRDKNFGENIPISNDNRELIKQIKGKKYKTLCINDSEEIADFEKVKNEVNAAFESKLSEKSSFEK